jgi:hypothetical protein
MLFYLFILLCSFSFSLFDFAETKFVCQFFFLTGNLCHHLADTLDSSCTRDHFLCFLTCNHCCDHHHSIAAIAHYTRAFQNHHPKSTSTIMALCSTKHSSDKAVVTTQTPTQPPHGVPVLQSSCTHHQQSAEDSPHPTNHNSNPLTTTTNHGSCSSPHHLTASISLQSPPCTCKIINFSNLQAIQKHTHQHRFQNHHRETTHGSHQFTRNQGITATQIDVGSIL